MICSKCGKEYPDDIKFCTECGAELTAAASEEQVNETVEVNETAVEEVTETAGEMQEAAETVEEVSEAVVEEVTESAEAEKEKVVEETKPKKIEKIKPEGASKGVKLGLALVAIFLLIFIPAVTLGGDDESYMKITDKVLFQITERDGDLYACYLDGEQLKLEDEKAYSVNYSMDGSVACYENEEDELVIINDGTIIKTGIDNVGETIISQRGDTVAFFTDCEFVTYQNNEYHYEDKIKVGTLNLYDVKKKTNTEIADEAVIESAVLSPNGKTVAFVAEYEATDDFKGFYSVNGKEPKEVGKEKRVFAISDKAKYIYYTDVDRIYVMKKDKEEKLANDVRYVEALMNADNTEMLFFNEGKTYITVKAGEKKKVAGEELNSVILNDDAATFEQGLDKERGDITVTYTGVDTFEGKLFLSDSNDEIYYMMNKYETEKLASGAYQFVVSDDRESLIYNNYADVVKVTKFTKGGEKETLAGGAYAESIYADGELKHVYLINRDDELYYVKKGKGKKIADDVTSAMISADGEYCYYVVEGEELCYSKKGGKEKELLTVEDGTVRCSREGGAALVATSDDGTYTLYEMKGKKPETVYVQEEFKLDDFKDDVLEDFEEFFE